MVLRESHVWYDLDLSDLRPKSPLALGLELGRGYERDLSAFAQLDSLAPEEARVLLRDGNELWMVREGDSPVFACWILRGSVPAIAAPRGRLALAPGMVCLENSVTAAAARGRGVAPAAWGAIAEGLANEGQRRLITKVAVDNVPSRRAVEKVGFENVALMHFKRTGPSARTTVEVVDERRGRFFLDSLEPDRAGSSLRSV